MGKTILIASIIVGMVILLLVSSQLAYAPPQSPRAAFSFQGSTTDGAPDITMNGGGNWLKGRSGIRAGGDFAGLDTVGSWRATVLNPTVGCCSPGTSGSGVVVFSARFNGADGQFFTRNVVVAENDVDLGGPSGVQNFWVQGFGFGTANARFN